MARLFLNMGHAREDDCEDVLEQGDVWKDDRRRDVLEGENVWEDDGEDVLEQRECLGGCW